MKAHLRELIKQARPMIKGLAEELANKLSDALEEAAPETVRSTRDPVQSRADRPIPYVPVDPRPADRPRRVRPSERLLQVAKADPEHAGFTPLGEQIHEELDRLDKAVERLERDLYGHARNF